MHNLVGLRTAYLIENIWKSQRRIHTVQDLFNIPLEPSVKPVRAVVDSFIPGSGEMGNDKLIKSWILYNAHLPNGNPNIWAPTLDTFGKKLRWKFYTTLTKWGLI